MTFEDRELLLREMTDRHNGHTQAFWTEWDDRYSKNTDGFHDTTDRAYDSNPELLRIHDSIPIKEEAQNATLTIPH